MKQKFYNLIFWILVGHFVSFAGMTVHAGMPTKRAGLTEPEKQISINMPATPPLLSVFIKSEGLLSKNKTDKNNKTSFHPSMPYTEIELNYHKTKNTSFLMEFSAEQRKHKWTVGFEEIKLSHSFISIPLQLDLGYLTLPMGYREKNKYLFSQEFSFYSVLEKKREDIALTADFKIKKDFLSVQTVVFGGWSYRALDKMYKPPDSLPFTISLKSKGPFWSAFATYFQKDPAFLDPLRAVGAGFHLKHTHQKLKLTFQSALWHIWEQGQSTIAFYILPSMALYKVQAGLVWGRLNRFFPDFKTAKGQSVLEDKAFFVALQAHPNIKFIGERWIGRQQKGPLSHDLWSFRIKVHFDFSFFEDRKQTNGQIKSLTSAL